MSNAANIRSTRSILQNLAIAAFDGEIDAREEAAIVRAAGHIANVEIEAVRQFRDRLVREVNERFAGRVPQALRGLAAPIFQPLARIETTLAAQRERQSFTANLSAGVESTFTSAAINDNWNNELADAFCAANDASAPNALWYCDSIDGVLLTPRDRFLPSYQGPTE